MTKIARSVIKFRFELHEYVASSQVLYEVWRLAIL